MARFSSIGGYRKVTNNSNKLYGQGGTPKCLHKQTIINAQISHITRKIKQTNGGAKGDDTQVSGVYLSKGRHIKTYMTKFVLACRESREVVDDKTNHREARMVFLVMNSIDTWENSKCSTMTTTHHVERF